MITIVYEVECECCGGTATATTLYTDQPGEDGRIYLDLLMVAEQVELTCQKCGCFTYTADLETDCDATCSDDDAKEATA